LIVHPPDWAQRLVLFGELPERDSEADQAYFGWYFLGEHVPGLPSADTEEGRKLVRLAERRAA
jgi:hypothetical protein